MKKSLILLLLGVTCSSQAAPGQAPWKRTATAIARLTQTNGPTSTATPTRTITPTRTPTRTPSETPTSTPTSAPVLTATATYSPTATALPALSPSPTMEPTPTTPQILSVTSQPCTETGCSLLVTWSASSAPYPIGYEVSRAPGYQQPWAVVGNTTETFWLDEGLASQAFYVYRVQAYHVEIGPESNVAEAATNASAQAGFATTAGLIALAGLSALAGIFYWLKRK